jgi:hypothetical protein
MDDKQRATHLEEAFAASREESLAGFDAPHQSYPSSFTVM